MNLQAQTVTKKDYQRAEQFLPRNVGKLVFRAEINPHWAKNKPFFWYRLDTRKGREYFLVDAEKESKRPLFDHKQLAANLSDVFEEQVNPYDLPLRDLNWKHSKNNPDPALDSFGAYGITGWYGHRNAYIFYDPGEGKALESVGFGTHLSDFLEKFYDNVVSYNSGETGLAPLLREFVHEKDPKTIAINQSRAISMADGLTVELRKYLVEAIGPKYASRLTSSEPMFIDYVSHRTPAELEIEKKASFKTWYILQRAFSNEVITPGKTRLMDVYWWIVDEWKSQDLEFNFPPGLDIQREGVGNSIPASENPAIQPGDVIHVDFGIKLMGLVTDQQKMAYVLREGEEEPPAGLQKAFENSQRAGEILVEEIEPGVLGHQIVK